MTKNGYKQTEIGIIPEDWELLSFDDAFSFLSNAAYSREQLSDNGEIYYVHYGDIHMKWNHFLNLKDEQLPTITKSLLKNFSLIRENDLIMADASEDYDGIGKSIEIVNIGDKNVISGLHTFLLRDKNNHFVPKFKAYLHSNKLIKKNYDKYATGLKVYGVSKTNLKKILIPLPPKPEQTAIATTLSSIDSLITSLQKLIDKKKMIKHGAMQELLTGKRRLPGFHGEWINKPIKELGKVINGGTPSTFVDLFWNGDIAWATPTDITGTQGKYIYETERYLTNDGLQNSSAQLLPKGTILLCSRATIGELKIADIPITTNQGFKSIICNNNCDNQFLYYKLLTIKNLLIEKAIGSTFLEISKNETENLVLFIPDNFIEQTAISTILSDLDLEIERLETKLFKLKSLKLGAMQQLLTGKIRLL